MKTLRNTFFLMLGILLTVACGGRDLDKIGRTEVVLETSMGDITIRLYDDTPQHRDNFVRLAREGFYDDIIWHRIVEQSTIQSGDPCLKKGGARPTADTSLLHYSLPAEIVYPRHFHKPGALAMARQPDSINVRRESSATQFYIVTGKVYSAEKLAELHQFMQDANPSARILPFTEAQKRIYTTKGGAPHLDGEYTVFGEVVDGMKVVEAIGRIKTDEKERPLKEVVLKKVRISRSGSEN